MMPCAIEYLASPTNRIPFGKTVGLRGKPRTIDEDSTGVPVYLWPVSGK